MVTQLSKPADLLGMVGQDIGTGLWHAITQHQVNIFADATHDHQWIHVEPERAAKGPYGGPIAHGYLTLSFCPVFLDDVLQIDAVTAAVNYGVNRVRFPAPVPVGSRIRGHVRLVSAQQKADRPGVRVRHPRRARGIRSAGLRHRDARDLPVAPPITKRRSNYQGSAVR